jgi:hypothetical protein
MKATEVVEHEPCTVVYNDYACEGAPWRIHKNGVDVGGFVYKHNAEETCAIIKQLGSEHANT